MSYGNETHAASHPVVAHATDDIMPMMPVTLPVADSEHMEVNLLPCQISI
jgi:hypothetical protein